MKTYFGLLLTFLSTSSLLGQYSISGNISEIASGEAVLATIYISDLERGTITNLDGYYIVENLKEGQYNLVISALGYRVISHEITVGDANVLLDLKMIASAIEMEEVIVSTPFHNLQSDNVMRVSRISADQLEQQGVASLSEGITAIAGVSSVSTGIGIGKPVIRGLSANRVLTYTQGIRLENQQFGDEHGLGIDGEGISSVEVIKGPASLLYGSDALGGVLYLNPERFAARGISEADARLKYFANTQGFSATAGFRNSGEKFKYLIRAGRNSHSDYRSGNKDRVTNSRFNQYDIKAGVQFRNQLLKTELRYNFNSAQLGIPETIGIQSTSKTPISPFQAIDSHILSLDNSLFLKAGTLDATLGYTHNNRIEFEQEDEGQIVPALDLNLDTFTYDFKFNFKKRGNFETIVGLQGMAQKNQNFGEEILIPNATKADIGVMGMSHWHLNKFDLMAGLRFDYRKIETEDARDSSAPDFIAAVNRDFSNFNMAFGVKYELIPAVQFRLNFASGFRAPNLAELTSKGVHVGTNRYEIGNANLTQEQSFMTDLSAELKTEHFEFIINAFYNTISDYIFVSPTGDFIDDNPVFIFEQSNAHLYGGEFGFHLHPHPLDWLHLESTFETVTGELKDGDYLPLIPATSIKNTLRFEINQKLDRRFGAFLNMTNVLNQNKISTFETPTGGYSLFNLGIHSERDFNKVTVLLSATLNNATNKEYISHLSRLKADGIADIGRSLVISARISLN